MNVLTECLSQGTSPASVISFAKEYLKQGAVVIDVGIHRNADNTLCGDVDFDDVAETVSAITPVPGGVGVMTRAMLMYNCVSAVYREAL